MGTNWVTGSYTNGQQRPSRYEPRLSIGLGFSVISVAGDGGQTWRRLEHLGAIAKTDQKERNCSPYASYIARRCIWVLLHLQVYASQEAVSDKWQVSKAG